MINLELRRIKRYTTHSGTRTRQKCSGISCVPVLVGTVPAVLSYQENNNRGQLKRAFCSASLVGSLVFRFALFAPFDKLLVSLTIFTRSQDPPHYHPGFYACIACCLLTLVIVAMLSVRFYFDNKK